MIDVTQRRLFAGIILATVAMWAILLADFQRGGQPDPPPLRAASTLLDGKWEFHTGDNPRWTGKNYEGDWDSIDLTAKPGSHDGDVGLPDYVSGWMAHGFPGYTGYAWYRRWVKVPAGAWDILGPTQVEDGYELYWNEKLLGGSGRLGPPARVVGTRPMRFTLPADAAGKSGLLAIRVFMLKRAGSSVTGGGLHSPPILAPRAIADGLHRAQWERTIAGYIADAVEPLAMFALIGLALWCWPRSSYRSFLSWAGIALALTAARRLDNALVSWTDVLDLPTYSLLAKYMWMPTVAAWALAFNRWRRPAWRSIDAAALVIMAAQVAGTMMHMASVTSISRYGSIALLLIIAARIAQGGAARLLALVTLALVTVSFFSDELLGPLGIPGIWFPFGIGVSRTQYIYAILIPLMGFLIARTLGDRRP